VYDIEKHRLTDDCFYISEGQRDNCELLMSVGYLGFCHWIMFVCCADRVYALEVIGPVAPRTTHFLQLLFESNSPYCLQLLKWLCEAGGLT